MWADANHWNRFRRAFERIGFRTRAVTLSFHDAPQDLAALRRAGVLDYVDRAADDIGPEQAILIGHSLGGLVAQKLAERGMAYALVLLATVAPAGIRPLTPSSALCISGNLLDLVLSRPFIIPPRNARFGLTNTLSRREQGVIQQSFLYESGRALREIVTGAIAVDEHKVRCPVLVGVGSEDRATPRTIARRVARKYDADYHEYSGKCHFIGGDSDVIADVVAWCDAVER
jgi:non-heme chloroperoxidase